MVGFERLEGLIRNERKREHFNQRKSREVGVKANIDNQSKLLTNIL